MKLTRTEFYCDKCKTKLPSCNNSIDIRTSLSEDSLWSRLHVIIQHKHGIHNNVTVDAAELCQECTLALLEDAISRIRTGERATKGTESSIQGNWDD